MQSNKLPFEESEYFKQHKETIHNIVQEREFIQKLKDAKLSFVCSQHAYAQSRGAPITYADIEILWRWYVTAMSGGGERNIPVEFADIVLKAVINIWGEEVLSKYV